MGKTKDLTLSGRGQYKEDKEIVTARGDIQIVPYKKWEFTIIRNPTGPTAQRAKRQNDPDLEKIKVGTIPVGAFLDAPVIDVPEKRTPPVVTPVRDLRPTSRTPEESRAMGMIPQEYGKRTWKPKKLKEKKEDASTE